MGKIIKSNKKLKNNNKQKKKPTLSKRKIMNKLYKYKDGNWAQRNFYQFICYNKQIYKDYVAQNTYILGVIQSNLGNKTSKDVEMYKQEIQAYVLSSSTAARFKTCVEACRKMINNLSFSYISEGDTLLSKTYYLDNEAYDEQGIIDAINSAMMQQGINIYDYVEKSEDKLQNIVSKLGTYDKDKKKFYDDIAGSFSGYFNDYIGRLVEQYKKIDGTNIVITDYGSVGYGSNDELGQALAKYLGRDNLFPKIKQSGLSQKIDDLIEYNINDRNMTFSVSMKSHWKKSGFDKQYVSIQGSAMTLNKLLDLASFYGVNYIHDNGYWRFLNDAFHNPSYIPYSLILLVYSAYFGNVDYVIEWTMLESNNEKLPFINIYTRDQIINYLWKNSRVRFEPYGSLTLWENYQDSDGEYNEQLILNTLKVAALNSIILSEIG